MRSGDMQSRPSCKARHYMFHISNALTHDSQRLCELLFQDILSKKYLVG